MPGVYFYLSNLGHAAEEFSLEEPATRHVVQVLRMQEGEELVLTDGRGLIASATILEAHKKKCRVRIGERKYQKPDLPHTAIALSLLKNSSRFEWFLEKATELGIAEIIPLKCMRTEKQQFRMERMTSIMESALIQSQQAWMPVLREPLPLDSFLEQAAAEQKFIAHCEPDEKRPIAGVLNTAASSSLILIGPEGDFTEEEIRQAMSAGFIPVSLGEHRLRSETAALAAAYVLKINA